jgi:hypothetical protein
MVNQLAGDSGEVSQLSARLASPVSTGALRIASDLLPSDSGEFGQSSSRNAIHLPTITLRPAPNPLIIGQGTVNIGNSSSMENRSARRDHNFMGESMHSNSV